MNRRDFRHETMGTGVTISLWTDADEDELRPSVDAAFAAFDELDRQFSLFKDDSEISRVNRSGGTTEASPRFVDAASYALGLRAVSAGRFEPVVGGEAAVEGDAVRLSEGASFDLNAVVKGMAIDLAMENLPAGIPAMIEAGGDILVRGEPPKGEAWEIGIRDPQAPEKLSTVVSVPGGAVCTSGEYFRGPHLRGRRSGNASMTVAAPTAREADALSTAAYFMPVDEAVAFVERFPGASCLAVDAHGTVFMSPRMRASFERHYGQEA